MRQRLLIFFRLAVFWFVLFMVSRALFLIYESERLAMLTPLEILLTFLYGSRMDFAVMGYFLMLSGLLLTFSAVLFPRFFGIIISWITGILAVLCITIVVVDLELYRNWGFRLNNAPLFYMGPEGFSSVQTGTLILLLLIFAGFVSLTIVAIRKFVTPHLLALNRPEYLAAPAMLLLSAVMFIPIRGSLGVAPMNTGVVYFSAHKPFANHAGVNVVWNFMYSLRTEGRVRYPEDLLSKDQTTYYFSEMMKDAGPAPALLKTNRPNVILIILEGYTASVVEAIGGMAGIAPRISEYSREGITFTNIYSSGDRTDKGLVSILSGYPAQPRTSIIKYPEKTEQLPSLTREFNALGYSTTFLYGGDIDFANMRSYLTNNGFNRIIADEDFPDELNTAKWGVRDEHVFNKLKDQVRETTGPFMITMLTLSSHEPFDVPQLLDTDDKNEASLFLNACHYTDQQAGKFLDWLRTQPEWDSTLVIMIADHGHRHPDEKALEVKERFHIPMIWVGGAVKQDTLIPTIGSQTDLANTLLGQMNHENEEFSFSRNLIAADAPSFATYFFNNGYGYVDTARYVIYDHTGEQYIRETGVSSEEELNYGKAYAQKLYTDYNNR